MYRSKMRFIVIPILGVAFVFLVSYLVMFLWNYTLPELFDVRTINLWQSMALFVLCKILFGFGKGGPRGGGPPWMRKSGYRKSSGLNEEEREKMKTYMRSKWCDWDDPTLAADKNDNIENHEK
ncbi:hypothetical protein [Parapedobacter tibetensis]|uniref:hypothetical protein n=1 Tax=Parapedobacter tibetensis TaxID=2972951 RepID=UPI00214DB779|nr:hypothetical protein [Parapedobacter tibetensis]